MRRRRSPAAPEPQANPNVLPSRSLWPAGQDEGDTETVDIALSQRSGDWACAKTIVKATAAPSLRREAGGGGKKDKVTVAVPLR